MSRKFSCSKTVRMFLEAPFRPETPIALTPSQCHYLMTVMRLTQGNPVRIFNGQDGEWLAHLKGASRKQGTLVPSECLRSQDQEIFLGLIFSPLRQTRLDFLLEKATELGVTDFYPVLMDHSAISKVNPQRFKTLAQEAAEQCERLSLPCFHPLMSLGEALSLWEKTSYALWVAVERSGSLKAFSAPFHGPDVSVPRGVLIGPEGGFSQREKTLLHQFPFMHRVSLGTRILRSETAALALLSQGLLTPAVSPDSCGIS